MDQVYGLGIAIPAGEDLNNYTTPGSYYSVNTANTATLSNLPDGVTSGFRLEVKANTGAGWNKQIMYPNGSVQRIWIRQQGGGWTDWYSTISNADFQSGNAALGDCAAGKTTDFKIVFPQPFASTPNVIICLRSSSTSDKYGLLTPYVANISTTGFTFRVANAHTSTLTPGGTWCAYN